MKAYKTVLLNILLSIMVISCQKDKSNIYYELEKFDSSLDSLISGNKLYNKPKFNVFEGDTLKNNPKEIIEICFLKTSEKDSVKIDANCHIYKFSDNELIINESEDVLGNKFVQKNLYFIDKIDNSLIDKLRSRKSDTVYIGNLKKYDSYGSIIKSVRSTEWKNVESNGNIVVNDNRIVEVFTNISGKKNAFRKEFFNKKYNVDSLKKVKPEEFGENYSWNSYKRGYSYKYDKHGNWTSKKQLKSEYPAVYYRTYKY